jgi:hypothetical protein
MTKRQAAWAEQHDWFVSAGGVKGMPQLWTVQVRCYDDVAEPFKIFRDYQELRAWAGY